MNNEALKFFLMMVREKTLRNRYYNGKNLLLAEAIKAERESDAYINQKLAAMRAQGWQNVPDDIPAVNRKK